MKKVILLATDTSSISGISGSLEIFRIANTLWNIQKPGSEPPFECKVVSTAKKRFKMSYGLSVEFDSNLTPYEQADLVVTTGFLYDNIDHLAEKVRKAKKAITWIQRQYFNGALVGASCSGTILLAESGLLDGKSATTSWWLNGFFSHRYPLIDLKLDQLLVKEGRLFTAGAMTSYLHLVLNLIEHFTNKDLALSCSKMMLIDFNKRSQAPYMMLQSLLDQPDDLVKQAQLWINEHFQKNINFNDLAKRFAVSYRTLNRRFKQAIGETPARYLQKIRIESAKQLMESTDYNLESIMERVGYSDPSSFSILFKRLTQMTPKEYRLKFSLRSSY